MKRTALLFLTLIMSVAAIAQADDMPGMKMQKPMTTEKKAENGYPATGVVKSLDKTKGTVTIAHGPIAGLGWPAMTMGFKVKDPQLFERLAVDKKVSFTVKQEGADYVVTSVQ